LKTPTGLIFIRFFKKCKDCILCGGVLENDYKPDEKKQLYAAFRAYDVLEDNKDLLQKPNSKINNAENVVENNLSIKKDEKNMKNEEISNEVSRKIIFPY